MGRRKRILAGLDVRHLTGLEIGALDKPLITRDIGPVLYADHAETAALRKKYMADPNVHAAAIVPVSIVWGEQSLPEALAGRQVDYVVASHVIEHVPDLIAWLNELASILAPGGQIRLAIPDMRYTFDCLRRPTTLSDVLPSYQARTRRPMPAQLRDFVTHAADVDSADLWRRPAGRAVKQRLHTSGDAEAVCAGSERGEYIDAHCWAFTPRSFAALMHEMNHADLIKLGCVSFIDTPVGGTEFYVGLSPAISTDWNAIAQRTRKRAILPVISPLRWWFELKMLAIGMRRRLA